MYTVSLMSKLSFIFLLTVLFVSCNQTSDDTVDENLPLAEQIDQLIENDKYEEALSLLEDEDREDPEIRLLLEKTHLNYGYYSMNTFDLDEMRTRMNNALVQFTEVLRINPENEAAKQQISQIMGVYDTMPDRGPEPEVLEGLREVGYY